jgi:hypothetical protein
MCLELERIYYGCNWHTIKESFQWLSSQGVEKGCVCVLGRRSRESGNPEVVDFKEPGFPKKPFGNDGFGVFQHPANHLKLQKNFLPKFGKRFQKI